MRKCLKSKKMKQEKLKTRKGNTYGYIFSFENTDIGIGKDFPATVGLGVKPDNAAIGMIHSGYGETWLTKKEALRIAKLIIKLANDTTKIK